MLRNPVPRTCTMVGVVESEVDSRRRPNSPFFFSFFDPPAVTSTNAGVASLTDASVNAMSASALVSSGAFVPFVKWASVPRLSSNSPGRKKYLFGLGVSTFGLWFGSDEARGSSNTRLQLLRLLPGASAGNVHFTAVSLSLVATAAATIRSSECVTTHRSPPTAATSGTPSPWPWPSSKPWL